MLLAIVVPVFMRKAAPQFMRLGDKRLKTIREIMDGIKLVKINAWEPVFLERMQAIRTEQLGWLKQFNMGVASFVIVGQVSSDECSNASVFNCSVCLSVGKHHYATCGALSLRT